MNLIVVGVSYRTAPVPVLERLVTSPAEVPPVLAQLLAQPYIGEALVLSTCNRVEVYAGVSAFHGGLTDIVSVLAARAGAAPADLAPHAYVHYDAEAVRHAYRVTTGLDSMVIGEAQILGQLRDAYAMAAEHDATGRLLHELMQQALRVGKRAHAETGIDRAGQSVVSAALNLAAVASSHAAGPHATDSEPAGSHAAGAEPVEGRGVLAGRSALVVGAGAMGSLAMATLRRSGADPLYVTSRGAERAARLAELYDATAVTGLDLSTVDIVVSATASSGHVITPADVTGPVTIVDLAVPRDVDPQVAALPGVELIDIERLGASLSADGGLSADKAAVEGIVAAEVEAFLAWLRSSDVAPTVAALRSRADDVVAVELRRLSQRRPELTDEQRADVARTIHRVVQRLLHQPTVRVRELAAGPGGDRYAALLRELFDLDVPSPGAVNGVPEVDS
ncbi:glutamyl-tRNA reductase [Rugosimonospora africana]|uniref:Glutamyl-tRNA reductase n=1 Tax=Rugosimonospora africana TaxID=556532 RepID=A0A8J3QJT2_9ACTN|nr:glutamyl-tRNA reductase [Rugosimonospora africana]GIH12300.1 glutamyl-tRNA reductase [Rugosimonospora africana]